MCGLSPGLSRKFIVGPLTTINKLPEGESPWRVPNWVLRGISSDHYPFGLPFPPPYFGIPKFYLPWGICLLLEKGGRFQLFDKLEERLHDFAGFLSKLVMACSQTEESNFLPPASLPPQPKFAL